MPPQLIDLLWVLMVFTLGLSIGSFLNVVIERVPRGLTLGGRSHCPACFHELGVSDLVPLLSFAALRSSCRYCQGSISWQYPAVEFITGLLFVLVFYAFPLPYSLIYLIFFSVLLTLFVIDLKWGVVPTAIVYPAIVLALVVRIGLPFLESLFVYQRLVSDSSGFGRYLLRAGFLTTHLWFQLQLVLMTVGGALLMALFFYFLVRLTKRRGMGSGDVFYIFLAALVTGFPNMWAMLFLTFFSGALVYLLLILLRKKRFGQTVPLGPFISLSSFIGVFWGRFLVDFYLNLLK